MSTLGSRMAERREKLGMSQGQLARELREECDRLELRTHRGKPLSCSQSLLSKIERPEGHPDHRTPDIKLIPVIANILGVSLRWLMTGEDDNELPPNVLRVAQGIVDLPQRKQYAFALILETTWHGPAPKDLVRTGTVPDVHEGDNHARRRAR